jgi:hypothetical protein
VVHTLNVLEVYLDRNSCELMQKYKKPAVLLALPVVILRGGGLASTYFEEM